MPSRGRFAARGIVRGLVDTPTPEWRAGLARSSSAVLFVLLPSRTVDRFVHPRTSFVSIAATH